MNGLQSVVFRRNETTLKEAKAFLRRHNLKDGEPDITPNTYRFRQMEPKPEYRYRTKPIPGGFLVLAYKD